MLDSQFTYSAAEGLHGTVEQARAVPSGRREIQVMKMLVLVGFAILFALSGCSGSEDTPPDGGLPDGGDGCDLEVDGDAFCASSNPAAQVCVDGRCVECRGPEQCGDTTPLCASSSCVACGEPGPSEPCAALGAATPVCSASGACVECTDHEQCDSQVCDRDNSVCVPEEQIVYVANGGFVGDQEVGEDTPGCGVPQSKCLTIRYAVDNRLDEELGRVWVRVADGIYVGDKLDLQDQSLRLIGGDETQVTLSGAPNDVAQIMVKVGQGVDVLIDRMLIRTLGAISEVIECTGAERIPSYVRFHRSSASGASGPGLDIEPHCSLEVVDSRIHNNQRGGIKFYTFTGQTVVVLSSVIEDNDDLGIDIEGGAIRVEQTLISKNRGGGIRTDNSDFLIRNNFIQNNGDLLSSSGGVKIVRDGPNQRIFDFNTVVGNRVYELQFSAPGIGCETFAPIEITNSIIWNNDGGNNGYVDPNAQINGFCEVSYSNVQGGVIQDGDRPVIGPGNIDTDPLFADPFRADYRIQAESMARDAADPESSIEIDFDGNPRPAGGGYDMGAYEVP